MDDTQHELLRSLGTIGEVQENDRLDAKGTKLEIQKPSLYNSFMRTFVYRQDKDDTISRVKSVVHETFDEVDRHVKSDKPSRKQLDFLSLLLDEMRGSVRGLQNLRKTYAGVSAGQDMKLYAKNMQKKCIVLREYLIRFGAIDDDSSSSGIEHAQGKRPVEKSAAAVRTVADSVLAVPLPVPSPPVLDTPMVTPMISPGKKNDGDAVVAVVAEAAPSPPPPAKPEEARTRQGVRPAPLDLSRVVLSYDCAPPLPHDVRMRALSHRHPNGFSFAGPATRPHTSETQNPTACQTITAVPVVYSSSGSEDGDDDDCDVDMLDDVTTEDSDDISCGKGTGSSDSSFF